jgi:hypothetical protein
VHKILFLNHLEIKIKRALSIFFLCTNNWPEFKSGFISNNLKQKLPHCQKCNHTLSEHIYICKHVQTNRGNGRRHMTLIKIKNERKRCNILFFRVKFLRRFETSFWSHLAELLEVCKEIINLFIRFMLAAHKLTSRTNT